MGKHLDTSDARVDFNIERWVLDRIVDNAENKKLTLRQWWAMAADRFLSSKEAVMNEKWEWIFTKHETTCLKCENKIPAQTRVIHAPDQGYLCCECWAKKYGDRGTLILLEQTDQLKENKRVLEAEDNALLKDVKFLNHQKKFDELLDKRLKVREVSDEVLRKNDRVLNLAEGYFTKGFEKDEVVKAMVEQLCKETDIFHEQREKQNQEDEALKPLLRHIEDFDKALVQEKLKKRKPLNEVPTE